jgi:hypothetical protein
MVVPERDPRRAPLVSPGAPMLTFAEEIMLLVLDDETGTIAPLGDYALNATLGGAVLMDLALRSKIDNDLESLVVVDDSPTGEEILDAVLAKVAASEQVLSPEAWVAEISRDGPEIRRKALDRLVERGILEMVDQKILWVFETRRYPVIDNREEQEVKRRLLDVILSDQIPDPRDVVLICLADACSLFELILSGRELDSAEPRIAQIRKLDLIGQAVANTVDRLRVELTKAMAYSHF